MNIANHYRSSDRDGRSHPDGSLTEYSQRLRAVAEGLGRFLEEHLRRLETAATQCEQVLAQKRTVERGAEELEQDRREFEQQRERQIDVVRQEQDRLIEAWHKLEGEQRRVITHQETAPALHDTVSFAAPAPGAPGPVGAASAPVEAAPAAVAEHRPLSIAATARQNPMPAMSRESALDQFQRLKREIRNHVQRVHRRPQTNGNH